jgi:hypothetical protein
VACEMPVSKRLRLRDGETEKDPLIALKLQDPA